jgi:DNA-binding GntR family transcriptional regulator
VAAKRSPDGGGKTLQLAPLQQDSTPTLIAQQLREAIATGEFAPGQQLLETSLAQALGLSRGPLREAMQRLTQEGLLISRRNRGLFVIDLDEAAVRDTYLARGAVERAAVEHLIESGRNAAAEVLIEIADRMEQYRADPSSDEISLLDLAFHEKLVELSGSPELQRMHRTLLTRVRMCLTYMQATYDSVDERMGEHRMLAEAIIAGDAGRATKLLREHMGDGMQRLLATAPDGHGATPEAHEDANAGKASRGR